MKMHMKYSSKDEKKKKSRELIFKYEDNKFTFEIILVNVLKFVATLMTSATFTEIVVKIVKLIMNRSFYYCCNNRIFAFLWRKYEY